MRRQDEMLPRFLIYRCMDVSHFIDRRMKTGIAKQAGKKFSASALQIGGRGYFTNLNQSLKIVVKMMINVIKNRLTEW